MVRAAIKGGTLLVCPVCFSDRLDTISVRMSKCESCGFIWNHEVSDRDNLLLIVEHQSKVEQLTPASSLQMVSSPKPKTAKGRKSKAN